MRTGRRLTYVSRSALGIIQLFNFKYEAPHTIIFLQTLTPGL